MEVTVWPNGRRGADQTTYGIKVRSADRDRFFLKSDPDIILEVEGRAVQKSLPPSFWRKCSEIRHPEITKYILLGGLNVWPKGRPPILQLEPLGKNTFRLSSQIGD